MNQTPPALGRGAAWFLALGGAAGLTAALVLTVEKFALLADPNYVPSCSINPVLSCGSVMITPQAAAFGFPNPLIGIVAFTIVVTTGVLTLGGVTLPRWYWVSLLAGTTLGVVFIQWLIFQSLYRIGALCPYCMVVWAVTVPIFAIVTRTALGHAPNVAVRSVINWRWTIVALWFALVFVLVFVRFEDYWMTIP
ncbi:vitamin K epoxide reductase family protein [Rhodococcus erythropolis]|uniref:vitamin K epoxide reductase family protein n=1 Tax=Rhodococcus erythropolis TaxID=1833 RepID=UPI00087916B4|nr:vitamin K epoxide reductase family protein [Rhodococcus erythropolis]OFV73522.1 vitamin K epoxide reductase family protein [Rhodococcus erythropolis]